MQESILTQTLQVCVASETQRFTMTLRNFSTFVDISDISDGPTNVLSIHVSFLRYLKYRNKFINIKKKIWSK